MKLFEEICREYGKPPEILERECYFIIRCKQMRNAQPRMEDIDCFAAILSMMHEDGYILRDGGYSYSLTSRGKRAFTRGWVYQDNKEVKKRKRLKSAYYILTFAFAAIAAIASVIGLFLR